MMKYFYTTNADGSIKALLHCRYSDGEEITEEAYNEYIETLRSIEDRDGYTKSVKLMPDGTYTVSYGEV